MSEKLDKILYVEDDPDIQAIAVMVLDAISGFTLEPCSSGSEALRKAVAFNPDLILLDVMMPGMDGPETLHALRLLPELANKPVVFMTAKVQSSEIESYKALGASDVVVKPFDPMTLSEQIRQIWQRQQT